MSIVTVQAIVIATAVLHNIACRMNNPEPPVDFDIIQLIDALEDHENPIANPNNTRVDTARRVLIDTYFRRFVTFVKHYELNRKCVSYLNSG